jgi:DNA replication protein DnaC
MKEDLVPILRYLRLGGLLARWDEHLALAADKRWSHAALLSHVLHEEYRLKRENARLLRLRGARIPELLTIETFPFARQPKLNRAKLMALYDSFDYVSKAQNILWLGATGCGKTGLATSFLVQAIQRGCTGRFVRFPDLVAELYRSVADHSSARVLKSYASVDILLIDEVGYVEVEPVQVGLFFALMQQRHRRKPTLITSNLGFAEWRSFLKNDHLAAALIDRLTETSHIFNLKDCVSLRARLNQEP